MRFSPRILLLSVGFVSTILIFAQFLLAPDVAALSDHRAALAAAPDSYETGVEVNAVSAGVQFSAAQPIDAAALSPESVAPDGNVIVEQNLAEPVEVGIQVTPNVDPAASQPAQQAPAVLNAAEVAAIPSNPPNAPIPDTASQPSVQLSTSGLDSFVQSLANGQAGVLRGIYVDGVMELRIVEQPAGDVGFVSMEAGTATLFQSPSYFDVVGLLAHNFLSGQLFYHINPGQEVYLVYGDGRTQGYRVTQVTHYQRLTLGDLQSDFIDLQTGARLSSNELFAQYYQGGHHLTLQTCLERDGISDWGLRFVVAEPL